MLFGEEQAPEPPAAVEAEAEAPTPLSDRDLEAPPMEPEPVSEEFFTPPAVQESAPVEAPVEDVPALEPGAAPHPAPVEPPPAPEPYTGPQRGTLVIIEDDQQVADYYATLFGGNGYRVEVANDGISGVDLCSRLQPEVILLDVMMPRQNGILVLQTLRASDETRETPVVVLSNFSEPTLIKRALQLGALEYVIKTQVEGAALLQAVPRWMKREKAFA